MGCSVRLTMVLFLLYVVTMTVYGATASNCQYFTEQISVDTTGTHQEKICKQCPERSGYLCSNDGEWESADIRCGSGHRNINGVCTNPKNENLVADLGEFVKNSCCFPIIAGFFVLLIIIYLFRKRDSTFVFIDKKDSDEEEELYGDDDY